MKTLNDTRQKQNYILLLISFIGFCFPSAIKANTTLPDSIVDEAHVYRYVFTDIKKSEKIMKELRLRKKVPEFKLYLVEGDLYFNSGRYILAEKQYMDGLRLNKVQHDEMLFTKYLHRLIACYDCMHNETMKAKSVRKLYEKAKQTNSKIMMALFLYYDGKSLYLQGNESKGLSFIEKAVRMMAPTNYDQKYDCMRVGYNTLIYYYTQQGRYKDALYALNNLERVVTKDIGGKHPIEGLPNMERSRFLAQRAVLLFKLGKKEEADKVYRECKALGEPSVADEDLIIPYLFDSKQYAEMLKLCRQCVNTLVANNDTINVYMTLALKYSGKANYILGNYKNAAKDFDRLAVLTDSIKEREQQSSSLELASVYETNEKDQQLQKQALIIAFGCFGLFVALLIMGIILKNDQLLRKKNSTLIMNVKEAIKYKNELLSRNKELLELKNTIISDKTHSITAKSRTVEESVQSISVNEKDKGLFDMLELEIQKNHLYLDPNLSRTMLIEKFGIPKNKFASLFKQFSGQSFNAYVNNLRMDYVVSLLLSDKYTTIDEVVNECPFASSTTFFRLFTQKYGMSPQKFIKNSKRKTANSFNENLRDN